MAGLIEGYEYDIFISYRQKDNKGDRWVSNFVEALKTELEAAFKEDISVYFDENPHDRLQETHNVDKSLEGKLKCLIFIPILSQTYCDPNSYAWQYEFLPFLRMAGQDRFGKDIKLRSGNVAGRILPIRIHDLEPEDINLFEKETGSVLRSLDFVFRTSTGVSRPLKASEDHPNDNLNKTYYSDQVNKVGHAIREIIIGMQREPAQVVKEKEQFKELSAEVREDNNIIHPKKTAKPFRNRLIPSVAVVALLIAAGIITYPKIFKRSALEKLRASEDRISVAVMPFQNMTNDTSRNFWQEMVQDNLITILSNSEELKVRQTESISSLLRDKDITDYASLTPDIASNVSQKLDAGVFIHGSINQIGSLIRLNAKLVDSKTEEIIKSFQTDGTSENILTVIDTLSAMVRDFLIISKLKQQKQIAYELSASTASPEAYRYFINGKEAFFKRDMNSAREMLLKAYAIDSNLTYAAFLITFTYSNQGIYDEAKRWCLRLYEKRDQMPLLVKTDVNRLYAQLFETPYSSIKYTKQLLEIDDQNPRFYHNLGGLYLDLDNYKAIDALEKALDIYRIWDSKPLWVLDYVYLGMAYHKTDQYRKEKKLYEKAEKDFPDNPEILYPQAVLFLTLGDTVAANQYIDRLVNIRRENSGSEAAIKGQLGSLYLDAGLLDQAEKYYRQALALEPKIPGRYRILANFLIDTERNIKEGLDLVEKYTEIIPVNYLILDTKGWAFYKLGKYSEALEILQEGWDMRLEKATYDHQAWLHLEAAKKAVAEMK